MRLGLRGRILLLVLVALAPPTVIALVVALEERHESRVHAQRDLLDTSRLVGADVERVIDGTATFLGAVSSDLARDPGRGHCEELLALVPRSTSRYSSVGVATAGGSVYCGATTRGLARPLDEVDVSGAGWFRAAQRGEGFVLGHLGREPLTGVRSLVAAHPVPRSDSEPQRVMFAALDIHHLTAATALNEVPRGTGYLLLDHEGTIIARAPAGPIGGRVPRRPPTEGTA